MYEKIVTLLKANIPDIPETISPDDRFLEDLNLCSLDFFYIMMLIEEEMNYVITDAKLRELRTVGELVRLLENREDMEHEAVLC